MKGAALTGYAVALDLLAGDPQSIPHPVSLVAAAVRRFEPLARHRFRDELLGGAILALTIVASASAAGAVLERAPSAIRVVAAASTLAAGSLLDHARAVRDALECGDLHRARRSVGRIVGRDTAALDASGVARAAIESLGESLCDGVVAPLLALGAFGLRGAFAYKAINTLDSLIGHIESPYTYFGRVAARLDDAANFVPARVTALLIASSALLLGRPGTGALRIAARDGRKHRSPNAGFGEAAIAGALRVRLGGRSFYDGAPYDAPLIGAEFRDPCSGDVTHAMRIVFVASLLAGGLAITVAWLRS